MATPEIGSPTRARIVRVGAGATLGADVAGGKGASLDRLTRLGLAVPPAFCVSADAFREQLASVTDPTTLARLLGALPDEAARAELVAAFDARPTLAGLSRAIGDAVEGLVRELDAALGQGASPAGPGSSGPQAFAVRSSALDEDGSTASFAGLHETELGRVAGEVEDAIRRCWSSLWSIPAVSYRARRGTRFDDLAMAVVVQVLVPAESSAVLFTRHPVSGRDDRILLTAIRGLGEPMVSGEATPDTIVVDRASRAIVERTPGRPGMRQFVEGGRIVERSDSLPTAVLSDEAVAALVELALTVEAGVGAPVDIEAAHAGGRWFLLQSRPITAGR
ncbi:MAG: PEP/pyruvate-binding domain-containing protein [Candidatus Limnocylindrales bacterium]